MTSGISSSKFGGMLLFDFGNDFGKWKADLGTRGMYDKWVHSETKDVIIVEPFEDCKHDYFNDKHDENDCDASEVIIYNDSKLDSLGIFEYEEALKVANDFMKVKHGGFSS